MVMIERSKRNKDRRVPSRDLAGLLARFDRLADLRHRTGSGSSRTGAQAASPSGRRRRKGYG